MSQQYLVTNGPVIVMTVCVCGDVFRYNGPQEGLESPRREWENAHAHCVKTQRTGEKVFWLSFCDGERPTGHQFLGACLIRVTAAEADESAMDVLLRFPMAQPGSEWLAAAIRKSHALKCNPGGEVGSVEIEPDHPNLVRYRFGVLMDRATIDRIDAVIEVES